jgi:hypothetical protein
VIFDVISPKIEFSFLMLLYSLIFLIERDIKYEGQ